MPSYWKRIESGKIFLNEHSIMKDTINLSDYYLLDVLIKMYTSFIFQDVWHESGLWEV